MEQKICVITGGSSGIGLCTALEMKAKGYEVFNISRRREGAAGINHISADVTDEKRINEAVSYIIDKAGRIDVLINNAGLEYPALSSLPKPQTPRKQFDVQFFRNGQYEQSRNTVYAQSRRRQDCKYKLGGGAYSNTVSGILFGCKGCNKLIYNGAYQ